jgi:hypothetical protein
MEKEFTAVSLFPQSTAANIIEYDDDGDGGGG